MRIESSYRGPQCPRCPACGGRHYPAIRGDVDRRVWCDGRPAESDEERAERIAQREQWKRRAESALREIRSERAKRGAETRRRLARMRALRAEHIERRVTLDAPPIDPTIDSGRIPPALPEEI